MENSSHGVDKVFKSAKRTYGHFIKPLIQLDLQGFRSLVEMGIFLSIYRWPENSNQRLFHNYIQEHSIK